ncbi:hypothetical protein JR316_0009457 [Psilocybe cubensis]|nr:hypothetical protein JR316_0009457 [Psilocybe cubensis]KAH9478993.1 hypothetical protein JR316_0009457 [Psilocybe cubensis]
MTVLTTITALYWLSFLDFILQWYFLNWAFIMNGNIKESIFFSSLDSPLWVSELLRIIETVIFVISDGLLVWRCYHVWGESKRIISIPLLFFFAECAMVITLTVVTAIWPPPQSRSRALLHNRIDSAFFLMCLVTTFIATFLIGYRIYPVSKQNTGSRTRYTHIIAIIIESSAAYLLALLLQVLSETIPEFTNLQSPLAESTYYIDSVSYVVSALAPTAMVLRLALSNTDDTVKDSTLAHISDMDFDDVQQDKAAVSGADYTNPDCGLSARVAGGENDQDLGMDQIEEQPRKDD